MLMMIHSFSQKSLIVFILCFLIVAGTSLHPVIFRKIHPYSSYNCAIQNNMIYLFVYLISVAGYMGTQLKYKLYKVNNAPFFCQRNIYSPRSLWLDAYQAFSPTKKNCWLHFMSLEYDEMTRKTMSPPGVQVIVPQMGDTEPIEYITPFPFHAKPGKFYSHYLKLSLNSFLFGSLEIFS